MCRGSRGSLVGSRLPRLRLGPLGLAVDNEAVNHDHAERENAQGPERVRAGDRQQRADRAEGRCDDPDQPAVGPAAEQRETRGELDDAEDQGDPAPGVEAREDVVRPLGGVKVRVADRADKSPASKPRSALRCQ